jgi:hypothetical protein
LSICTYKTGLGEWASYQASTLLSLEVMRLRQPSNTYQLGGIARGVIVGVLFHLLFPSLTRAQGLARDALSNFPADTQQVAYLNLAQLRSLAEYPQIRNYLLNRQFRDFQDFLRSLGVDSEKDVDEVMLGWRMESGSLVGRAEGRFDGERVRKLVVQQQMPIREYQGYELYSFGSGEDPTDVVYVFLSSSSAAFGKLRDVKDLLDVRAGAKPALDTNSAFVGWEAELEGTSPQWGISTGKMAASQAGPWLAAGSKPGLDPSVLFGPVQAVLYRMDWNGGVITHVSILCQNNESASAFAQLLSILRDARPAAGANPLPAGLLTLVQGLEAHANGSRVELTTTAPLEAMEQLVRSGETH